MCECVCVKFSHEKEKKILPFATMWMDIEHIMLNKINKRKTSAAWYHLCMVSLIWGTSTTTSYLYRNREKSGCQSVGN